jgi:DNA-binding MarR family transcriptional regulator
MTAQLTREDSYLALVAFLLTSKQRLFELGDLYDMNGLQTMTILLLDQPQNMGNFKTTFHCDPSNITAIMDVLEDRKLVARYISPTDHRIKMVKLLPKGERLRTELLRRLTDDDSYLLANLSPEETATFTRLVQKITTKNEA